MKKFIKFGSTLCLLFTLMSCSSLSNLVEKPQLSIADFQMTQANIFQQTFSVRLKVDNPNSFALPILGMNYGLSISGIDVTKGTSNKGVRVPANGTDYLEVDFNTNLLKTLPDLKDLITTGGKNLSYNFKGDVNLDNRFIKSIPFDKTGEFDLNF